MLIGRVNVEALADWAIRTGRAPLNGRERILNAAALNPLSIGALLIAEPTRQDAPCPLFTAPDRRRSAISANAAEKRYAKSASATNERVRRLDSALREVLDRMGVDTRSQEGRAAVTEALRAARADSRQRQARVIKNRKRRMERERQRAAAPWNERIAAMWAPEESAEHEGASA